MTARHRPWTDARVDALGRLWRDGRSAAEIARRLEVTRNAVAGKLDRLHLHRSDQARRAAAELGALKGAGDPFGPQDELAFKLYPAGAEACPLLALEPGQCRFPVGEACGPAQLFCAAPGGPGVYCREHHAIARRPAPRRAGP